jgi:hypothetical protein
MEPAGRIEVYAVERRTQIIPGQPPTTIEREVVVRNGKTQKAVRVLRGNRVISNSTRKLKHKEKRRIQKRKYVTGLYKGMERETLQRLNA